MGNWRKYLYLLTGLIIGATFSQFPEFHQQYFQRLGGTLDELDRQVEALDSRAASTDMTRYNYIRHLTASSDKAAQMEGEHLTNLLRRQFDVQQALNALGDASPQMMAILVLYHLDINTAKATAEVYKPAVPLTISGGIYFGIGFLIGYILMAFLMLFFPRKVLQSEPD
ncbi:DUF2937 family protein [Curvivirga aplysinae]|uniref:DUF2937 family protein n=1 Tax=Curvivirga aplysinae TaxID=2529852 RepID=UPI0012BD7D2D|nr:DUF2937 family protein [Curvivirga aplysinae]MTI09054.1 DUF2937 family protein [Curvivirga aplysinae]